MIGPSPNIRCALFFLGLAPLTQVRNYMFLSLPHHAGRAKQD